MSGIDEEYPCDNCEDSCCSGCVFFEDDWFDEDLWFDEWDVIDEELWEEL